MNLNALGLGAVMAVPAMTECAVHATIHADTLPCSGIAIKLSVFLSFFVLRASPERPMIT
jgi:hypothetical protein